MEESGLGAASLRSRVLRSRTFPSFTRSLRLRLPRAVVILSFSSFRLPPLTPVTPGSVPLVAFRSLAVRWRFLLFVRSDSLGIA